MKQLPNCFMFVAMRVSLSCPVSVSVLHSIKSLAKLLFFIYISISISGPNEIQTCPVDKTPLLSILIFTFYCLECRIHRQTNSHRTTTKKKKYIYHQF